MTDHPKKTMNTIYIVAIGGEYTQSLWAKDSIKAWENYCDRHDLHLHVQTKSLFPFKEKTRMPHFEKFGFLNQDFAGSILIVDIDSIPSPHAPDAFALHSDNNITCRVSPYWHRNHSSFGWCDAKKLHALRWPRFKDVKKGEGRWPDGDLWFFVSGGIMLAPSNVQNMFRENHARIMQETPAWNFSLDEGVWAFWIAKFNREFDLGVDAFDPWKWAVPSGSRYFARGQVMPVDCYTVNFHVRKSLSRQYTKRYFLDSINGVLAATVLWGIRALFALRPMHAHLMLRRAASFALRTARKIVRHLAPPPPAITPIPRLAFATQFACRSPR